MDSNEEEQSKEDEIAKRYPVSTSTDRFSSCPHRSNCPVSFNSSLIRLTSSSFRFGVLLFKQAVQAVSVAYQTFRVRRRSLFGSLWFSLFKAGYAFNKPIPKICQPAIFEEEDGSCRPRASVCCRVRWEFACWMHATEAGQKNFRFTGLTQTSGG